MFHQANIIPAADLDGKSALKKWYEDVMATLSLLITFPVKVTFCFFYFIKIQDVSPMKHTYVVAELNKADTGIVSVQCFHSNTSGTIKKHKHDCELNCKYCRCLERFYRLRNLLAVGYLASFR